MGFINKSKSLDNSFLYKTTKKSSVTAKSLLDKIKSLGISTSTNTNNGLDDINTPISSSVPDFELDNTFSSNSQDYNFENNKPSIFWNIIRYSIVIIILGFIILNILAAMNLLTPNLEKIFNPILKFFGHTIKKTIKPTTTIDKSSPSKENTPSKKNIPSEQTTTSEKTTLDTRIEKDLDNLESDIISKQDVEQIFNNSKDNTNYPNPDESGSITQNSQGSSKSGFCFIGEDRGFRSCIKVGINDTCMSGDIFPTQEICVNPNLRM